MNLKELQQNWNRFGKEDPMWAILTDSEKKGNKWSEEEFFLTGEKHVQKELKHMRRRHPALQLGSALDFGCGLGRLTQGLAVHFEQVHGVDIAPSMIDGANQLNKHKEKCTYHLNQKNDLSLFEDNKFDLVLSLITLQHMQPKYAKNYISEFLRVLKPGGMLLFQIPSVPDERTRKRHSPIRKIKKAAYRLFRPKANKKDAVMEMYWISLGEMAPFLESKGGVIDRVLRDQSAGNTWISYAYYVIKPDN